jgi:RNA polymerase sigma-70 factor (ECF subfamily)
VAEVDDRVVAGAQRGDQAAFREIIDHYEERLRLLAFQLLRDRERMNDALQDTFVKAYRGLPGFRGDASLGTWLYRICYRVCLDYLRKERSDPLFEAVDEQMADPDDGIHRFALREQVMRAVAALPLEQRVVLLLIEHAGYDYEGVAEILDIPAGTVASRLSLARKAVRSVLCLEGLEERS